MKWSWKIGRVAGIDVYVHATFFILLVWIGLAYYMENKNWADVAGGLIFILSLFGIVVLHELGHALTARRFGISTRDITLLPIGGVARLERIPEDPKQELLIALAGPAVNVVLAVLFLLIAIPLGGLGSLGEVVVVGGKFVNTLVWVNVILAVFNLLPAFPMDGGRVLRALLAMRLDYVHATQIAASVGQSMALAFGILGLFINPWLVFIALFVWIGAEQEAGMTRIKAALGGIPVERAMITNFVALEPDDTLHTVVEHILSGFQQDFPVVERGHVVGMLIRQDVMKALAQRGDDVAVEEVMQREFVTAAPNETMETIFMRLQECQCRSIPVVYLDRLVGIMTMENVGEFVMVQTADETAHNRAPGRTFSAALFEQKHPV